MTFMRTKTISGNSTKRASNHLLRLYAGDLSRLAVSAILALCLFASCTSSSTTQSPGGHEDCAGAAGSGDKSDQANEFYNLLHTLYSAKPVPGTGGGITRGGTKGESISRSYKDIAEIRNLIRGPKDLNKFEVLLVLLRDADFSVHINALETMKDKFSYQAHPLRRNALTNSEQLEIYKDAYEWWEQHRTRLQWNRFGKRFEIQR